MTLNKRNCNFAIRSANSQRWNADTVRVKSGANPADSAAIQPAQNAHTSEHAHASHGPRTAAHSNAKSIPGFSTATAAAATADPSQPGYAASNYGCPESERCVRRSINLITKLHHHFIRIQYFMRFVCHLLQVTATNIRNTMH